MAELAKEDIDAIVSAIGFGIVGDFRSLQTAMGALASHSAENNRLLGEVNDNLMSTDRSLDRLEKDIYRQIDARQFSQLENAMEKKSKATSRRADQILTQVQRSLSELQRETARGNRELNTSAGNDGGRDNKIPQPSSEEEINRFLDKVKSTGGSSGADLSQPPSMSGAVGAGVALGALAIGGIAAVAGTASIAKNETSTPVDALATPTEPATPQTPSITAPTNRGTATQTPTASTTGAVSAASQVVSASTTSLKSKALQKITNKLSDWVNKNSARVTAIIGVGNEAVLGRLVGGTFSFNRFLTDDAWTGLGERYVMGETLSPAQTKDPNAAYVAGVVVNLAILSYLACRDVYTRENYREIVDGSVPNFDDLGSSEKSQYVKNAGAVIESYVNKLISEKKQLVSPQQVPSTVGPAPDATSPESSLSPISSAEAATAPKSSSSAIKSSQLQVSTDGGGTLTGIDSSGGQGNSPSSGVEQPTTPSLDFTGSGRNTGSSSGESSDTGDATPSGGDSIASIDMSSSVLTDINGEGSASGSSGNWNEMLDYIADSEGAGYNTQYANQHTTDKPLTSMTVSEIMQAQRRQRGSSAIGRYQFMSQTMRDGIAAGIIKPDEKFSPEMQDRLATWLIESKRKGSAWRSGKINDEQFAQGLAQEWASIPSPYTGKGVYSGQRAKHGVDKLMRVIKSTKQSSVVDAPTDSTVVDSVPRAAKGAIITPLPKSPTDTINLAPPRSDTESRDDEDEFTSSSAPIDARPRTYSANPNDEMKNKLAFYSDYMNHHFGYLSEEFDLHTNGELTADEAFKRAMNPLI